MLRPIVVCALLTILGSSVSPAQQADELYRRLFMEGVREAGEKNYAKAEQTLAGALKEAQRFGADDIRVGSAENTIGLVYVAEGKYGEGEAAYRKALGIFETTYGKDSLDVAKVRFNIASVLFNQGHPADALPYIRQALQTYEGQLGGTSVTTASALCLEGDAYRAMKEYSAAEGPLRRCADIRERDGGIQNADLADALYRLALVYAGEGKYGLAEPRIKLAEKIRESMLGLTSPLLAETMEEHAAVLRSMGREKEAEKLTTLAAAIRRSEKKSQ